LRARVPRLSARVPPSESVCTIGVHLVAHTRLLIAMTLVTLNFVAIIVTTNITITTITAAVVTLVLLGIAYCRREIAFTSHLLSAASKTSSRARHFKNRLFRSANSAQEGDHIVIVLFDGHCERGSVAVPAAQLTAVAREHSKCIEPGSRSHVSFC
jgi:hypothetical protein